MLKILTFQNQRTTLRPSSRQRDQLKSPATIVQHLDGNVVEQSLFGGCELNIDGATGSSCYAFAAVVALDELWSLRPCQSNFEMVTAALPRLVNVTVCAALTVPFFWSPKFRLDGDKLITVPRRDVNQCRKETLDITKIAFTGTNAGNFLQTNNCGTTVSVGASCAVNMVFEPTGKGNRFASLTVVDNAASVGCAAGRVRLVKTLIFRIKPQKKAAPRGRPESQTKSCYGITPAGACGAGPTVVAAAASFKIL